MGAFPPGYSAVGSSPRGRGTLVIDRADRQVERFIPAWAGNTAANRFNASLQSVHPRVGGEHLPADPRIRQFIGSSPRGRGTLAIPFSVWPVYRFIPAWAGNTLPGGASRARSAVHPRVGGEHYRMAEHYGINNGSSPRGRGTLTSLRVIHGRSRFIPAWAGNTWHPSRKAAAGPVHPRVGGEH